MHGSSRPSSWSSRALHRQHRLPMSQSRGNLRSYGERRQRQRARRSAALGTRVGTLLGEDAGGAPLATFGPDAPRHTAAGLEIAASSGFPDSRALDVLRVHVPANRQPSAPVRHRGEEWIYVLRGTLDLEFDGMLYALGTDMAAHFDATRPHRLSAGDGDAELLVVNADSRPGLTAIAH